MTDTKSLIVTAVGLAASVASPLILAGLGKLETNRRNKKANIVVLNKKHYSMI